MTLKFTVGGRPHGKARPRFDSRSKRAYTSDATRAYEELVRLCYRTKHGETRLDGEIHAVITAYWPIPNANKSNRERMLAGEIKPTGRPDLDNVIKSILDALNGVAYSDDSAVISVTAEKRYAENPRVDVMLTNEH